MTYFEALLCMSDVVTADTASSGWHLGIESLTASPPSVAAPSLAACTSFLFTSCTTVSADEGSRPPSSPTLKTGLDLSDNPSDAAAGSLLMAAGGSVTDRQTDRHTDRILRPQKKSFKRHAKCFTVSPRNPFILILKGQRSRSQVAKTLPAWVNYFVHSCECWLLLIFQRAAELSIYGHV